MTPSTPFYRIRWVLEAKSRIVMHPWQHAVLYALLCDAGRGDGTEAEMRIPEGFLLDAPETGRMWLEAGDTFAFGGTLIESSPQQAAAKLHRMSRGLMRVGSVKPKNATTFGGNFNLIEVQDIIASRSVQSGEEFVHLKWDTITRECEHLLVKLHEPITLRFHSPLRMELGKDDAREGHRYVGSDHFNATLLLRAFERRIETLGISKADEATDLTTLKLVNNELVWLDLGYGTRNNRKSLGGALGRISVIADDTTTLAALVWGQYTRIGRNLNFGFGQYRIEELGHDPVACQRTVSLLDLALSEIKVRSLATEYQLEANSLVESAQELQKNEYKPAEPHRVYIDKVDGTSRRLDIPPPRDRALQRLLLNQVGPVFDRLFETSSFAWRSGLSRESAAMRIERLSNQGWKFAVRADFDQFFDSISHSLLKNRVAAWAGDDRLASAILAFVPLGKGIPTGAPLSPLLGNLFLDQFDEAIEKLGSQLVRYADDFLILTKTREEADRLHTEAKKLATELELQLNADSAVIDLREPFDFLGYEFRMEERWLYNGPHGPKSISELGWKDSDRVPSLQQIPLPGEAPTSAPTSVAILGPDIEFLDVVGDRINIRLMNRKSQEVPLAGLDEVIILGHPNWSSDAPGKLLKSGVPVHLNSEFGWPLGWLVTEPVEDADAILAQSQARSEPSKILSIAITLVRAKIHNHRALLLELDPQSKDVTKFSEAISKCSYAVSLDELRGIEGATAAIWYRCLGRFLGNGFYFSNRVSPRAHDPINVLMNIGHTLMYRQAITAARSAGLTPVIGFLHTPNSRFAALATDLQEPFRHLVDRAVILASRRLKPKQFHPKSETDPTLIIEHHAAKTFHVILQRTLTASVTARGQTEPRAWISQMIATARSLKRHLLDPAFTFQPFEHL